MRDFANLGSQAAVKAISVPFGLLVTGLLVRHLNGRDAYLLLAAANYLGFVGVLQLGLNTYALITLSHKWARDADLHDLTEIRAVFVALLGISLTGSLAAIVAAAKGILPMPILPTILLGLAALWASTADQVRVAVGRAYTMNLIQISSYLACGALTFVAIAAKEVTSANAILAALAAPYLSSLLSFAFLMRESSFRVLIVPQGRIDVIGPVVRSMPVFLVTLGATILYNAPLAGGISTRFPRLDLGSLACLRLTLSILNIYFFILQPLAPIILRQQYKAALAGPSSHRYVLLGTLLSANVVISGLYFLLLPVAVREWLGQVEVSPHLALQWALICAAWMSLAAGAYVCQLLLRSIYAAIGFFSATVAMICLEVLFGLRVEPAMLVGVYLGAAIAVTGAALLLKERAA